MFNAATTLEFAARLWPKEVLPLVLRAKLQLAAVVGGGGNSSSKKKQKKRSKREGGSTKEDVPQLQGLARTRTLL